MNKRKNRRRRVPPNVRAFRAAWCFVVRRDLWGWSAKESAADLGVTTETVTKVWARHHIEYAPGFARTAPWPAPPLTARTS